VDRGGHPFHPGERQRQWFTPCRHSGMAPLRRRPLPGTSFVSMVGAATMWQRQGGRRRSSM
jgi:hypothetical protein